MKALQDYICLPRSQPMCTPGHHKKCVCLGVHGCERVCVVCPACRWKSVPSDRPGLDSFNNGHTHTHTHTHKHTNTYTHTHTHTHKHTHKHTHTHTQTHTQTQTRGTAVLPDSVQCITPTLKTRSARPVVVRACFCGCY